MEELRIVVLKFQGIKTRYLTNKVPIFLDDCLKIPLGTLLNQLYDLKKAIAKNIGN